MTLVWSGLEIGAIYALVAIGYNVVFVASNVFNFAHAQLLMLGTFIAYWGLSVLRLPLVLVVLLCGAVVAAVAVAEERLAIRPVRDPSVQLVTTVGAATLLQGGVQAIWGTNPLEVPFRGPTKVLSLLGGAVFPVDLAVIAAAIVMTVLVVLLLRRTRFGLAVLAIAEDREAGSLCGINVRLLALVAFALAGLLAGIVGPVVGPETFAVASLSSALAITGFVAAALGGFGSVVGGLLGGLLVGMTEQLSTRFVGTNYSDISVFALLVVVLMVKPTGIFGQRQERRV